MHCDRVRTYLGCIVASTSESARASRNARRESTELVTYHHWCGDVLRIPEAKVKNVFMEAVS